jgi:dolichol-phosphate mannosyltransferase
VKAVRGLLVLPTYDEADNIAPILRHIRAVDPGLDVLVVDDASPDGTGKIASEEGRRLGGVIVLSRAGKQGLGSAYRAGFAWGLERGYDVLIEMDADLSHDPKDLVRLVATLDDGADLVIGSRYIPGGAIPAWSWHRRMLSRGGNQYARVLLGLHVSDMTSGYRAYRASVLSRVPLHRVRSDGYGFQIEMVRQMARVGGRVVEIPISFSDRVQGRSKMSARIVVEALALVTYWGLRDRTRGRRRVPTRRSGTNGELR